MRVNDEYYTRRNTESKDTTAIRTQPQAAENLTLLEHGLRENHLLDRYPESAHICRLSKTEACSNTTIRRYPRSSEGEFSHSWRVSLFKSCADLPSEG